MAAATSTYCASKARCCAARTAAAAFMCSPAPVASKDRRSRVRRQLLDEGVREVEVRVHVVDVVVVLEILEQLEEPPGDGFVLLGAAPGCVRSWPSRPLGALLDEGFQDGPSA